MERTIIRNRAKCLNCLEVLESVKKDELVTCVCYRDYINKLYIDYPEDNPEVTLEEFIKFKNESKSGISISGGNVALIRYGNIQEHLEEQSIMYEEAEDGEITMYFLEDLIEDTEPETNPPSDEKDDK